MPKPLRAYLEAQADRVEMILSSHRVPGRVTGGTVGPRIVRFFVADAGGKIKEHADDLALALRVSSVSIEWLTDERCWVLEFENPNPSPVYLMRLLPQMLEDENGDFEPLPLGTVVLGLTDDGIPLSARLPSDGIRHVLIAGREGAGKSALLRTAALSLALTNHADDVRMICVGTAFEPLRGLRHINRGPIVDPSETREMLISLGHLVRSRAASNEKEPRLVLLIDDVESLIHADSDIERGLVSLVRHAHLVGVHVIAAVERPSLDLVHSLVSAEFPLRIVGACHNAADARASAGQPDTNAIDLHGRGDFVTIGGGEAPLRFQSAYVGTRETEQAVRALGMDPQRYRPHRQKDRQQIITVA